MMLGRAACGVLVALAAARPASAKTDALCASEGPAAGPGSLEPFRSPAAKAVELNAAGKTPYRQGKWDEARAQYRAAEAADPEFLAPKLNVACSFVRQERFAEATAEVVGLLSRAYVPWAKEILDAADLGALKVRPEMKEIERAMAASAARWGEGLDASVLFVARQRPPLHVPDGAGVFILNPHQEVWAYAPRTRRYRQLTAEDGHVLALARSGDGRRALYVTAEKLVRGAKPQELALRDFAIHELTLATMTTVSTAKLEGDVLKLEISSTLEIVIKTERSEARYRLTPSGTLAPSPTPRRADKPAVLLTGQGVAPRGERRLEGPCSWIAREGKSDGGLPTLSVGPRGGPLIRLEAGQGAGAAGLALP